jgi:hypothetical protein
MFRLLRQSRQDQTVEEGRPDERHASLRPAWVSARARARLACRAMMHGPHAHMGRRAYSKSSRVSQTEAPVPISHLPSFQGV